MPVSTFLSGLSCPLAVAAVLVAGVLAPAAAQTIDVSFAVANAEHAALYIPVRSMAPDAQGRFLIGGSFDFVAGRRSGGVARILADGTLDATFNPGGAGA